MKHRDRITAALAGALLLPLVVAADPPATPAPRQLPVTRRPPRAARRGAEGAGGRGLRGVRSSRRGGAPLQTRRSRGLDFTVDACGRLLYDQEPYPSRDPSGGGAGPRAHDRPHDDGGRDPLRITSRLLGLHLMQSADVYTLSDGSPWSSGAGTHRIHSTEVERVEVSGSTIRYVLMTPPFSGRIYEQQDFDFGDHSAQGVLAASGPLVLEATAGSTTAVLRETRSSWRTPRPRTALPGSTTTGQWSAR